MLQGQTFEASDAGKVALIVLLEALLSADNALILAIIVRHLPKDQQKRALFYGLAGAFVLRFIAIFLAASILNYWWLQVLGALYLIYLPVKHFVKHASTTGHKGAEGAGFWMTVIYADLIDLVFAIDSVLVAVAVVNAKDKLWVIYAGAFIGIVLLRFAAGFCLRLLERYPILDHIAYALVGWAGVKMLLVGGHTWTLWYDKANPKTPLDWAFPEMPAWMFWGGMALIVGVGLILAFRHPTRDPEIHELREETPGLDPDEPQES